jgi:cell division protein FtsL
MTKYAKKVKVHKYKKDKSGRFSRLGAKFKLDKKAIGLFLICLICFSLLTYLVQINNMATRGFEIRELEDQIKLLKQDNQHLELQLIDLQSMTYISQQIKHLNLVEAHDVQYLDTSGTTFVQR